MKLINNFFTKTDHIIQSYVSEIKSNNLYQNIISNIDSLEEPLPKIIYHSFNYVFILIPVILILVIFSSNSRQREMINTKKNIVDKISHLEKIKRSYNRDKKNFLVKSSTLSKTSLTNKLNSIVSGLNIDQANISVKTFTKLNYVDNIKLVKSTLVFKNLSTKLFTKFTSHLINIQNIKLNKINISKENSSGTILGELHLEYFSE